MIDHITILALLVAAGALIAINLILIEKVNALEKKGPELKAWQQWLERKVKHAETAASLTIEQRCQHCQEGPECPGYNSGVIYPCEHYKELEE